MGHANRAAVERQWAQTFTRGRNARALLVLLKMADRVPDPDPRDPTRRPRYWSGPDELAYAAGVLRPGEPMTKKAHEVVSRLVGTCRDLGAIKVVTIAGPGRRAEYELILDLVDIPQKPWG